jgi:hypothetical protein
MNGRNPNKWISFQSRTNRALPYAKINRDAERIKESQTELDAHLHGKHFQDFMESWAHRCDIHNDHSSPQTAAKCNELRAQANAVPDSTIPATEPDILDNLLSEEFES